MELYELLEINRNRIAVLDAVLGDCPRGETFKCSRVDLITFDEGFEVI